MYLFVSVSDVLFFHLLLGGKVQKEKTKKPSNFILEVHLRYTEKHICCVRRCVIR